MATSNQSIYKNSLTLDILLLLFSGKQEMQRVLKRQMSGLEWREKMKDQQFRVAIHHLKNNGWIKKKKVADKIYFQITREGKMQALRFKLKTYSRVRSEKSTIVIFDIPEEKRTYRNSIRSLFRQMDFTMLQKSVFITPNVLPEEFYDYLRQLGILENFLFVKGTLELKR